MNAWPDLALEWHLQVADPKKLVTPYQQQAPFDNSGWQESENDEPNELEGAHLRPPSTLQSA